VDDNDEHGRISERRIGDKTCALASSLSRNMPRMKAEEMSASIEIAVQKELELITH
jgi:hypothetical protein